MGWRVRYLYWGIVTAWLGLQASTNYFFADGLEPLFDFSSNQTNSMNLVYQKGQSYRDDESEIERRVVREGSNLQLDLIQESDKSPIQEAVWKPTANHKISNIKCKSMLTYSWRYGVRTGSRWGRPFFILGVNLGQLEWDYKYSSESYHQQMDLEWGVHWGIGYQIDIIRTKNNAVSLMGIYEYSHNNIVKGRWVEWSDYINKYDRRTLSKTTNDRITNSYSRKVKEGQAVSESYDVSVVWSHYIGARGVSVTGWVKLNLISLYCIRSQVNYEVKNIDTGAIDGVEVFLQDQEVRLKMLWRQSIRLPSISMGAFIDIGMNQSLEWSIIAGNTWGVGVAYGFRY